jgi:hypothetical protein
MRLQRRLNREQRRLHLLVEMQAEQAQRVGHLILQLRQEEKAQQPLPPLQPPRILTPGKPEPEEPMPDPALEIAQLIGLQQPNS